MSLKYEIIKSTDLKDDWDLFGDVSEPRESLDGTKLLVKFNTLPNGMKGMTEEQVSETMQTDEWSISLINEI